MLRTRGLTLRGGAVMLRRAVTLHSGNSATKRGVDIAFYY